MKQPDDYYGIKAYKNKKKHEKERKERIDTLVEQIANELKNYGNKPGSKT